MSFKTTLFYYLLMLYCIFLTMYVLIFILGFRSAGPFWACSELTKFCMHLNCHLFLFSIFSKDARLFLGLQMLEADSAEACPDYSLFSIYHQFGCSPLVPQALSWKKVNPLILTCASLVYAHLLAFCSLLPMFVYCLQWSLVSLQSEHVTRVWTPYVRSKASFYHNAWSTRRSSYAPSQSTLGSKCEPMS